MRSMLILLAAPFALGYISCNNNSTTSETKNTDTAATANTSALPAQDNDVYAGVPQSARTNFESRYPQASGVKWARYQPKEAELSDWNTKLDTSDYQVNFNWEGLDYTAWYDDTNWIGSTARITDNSKLPAPVNDAIQKQYPGYTIKEVDKQNDKNQTVYEVDLEKSGEKLKVHFDENGKLIKMKGKVNGKKVKEKANTK